MTDANRRCAATTRKGNACRSPSETLVRDADGLWRCRTHSTNPEVAAAMALARRRGTLASQGLDPALAALSDDELMKQYEQALAGDKGERRPPERGPLFRDVSDEELLRQYDADKAEERRSRPKKPTKASPPPAPVEPHPVKLDTPPPAPPKPPAPDPRAGLAPHVQYPVDDCTCVQCAMHRSLDRVAVRDAERAKRSANDPMIGEPVWHVHPPPTRE